MHNNDNELIIYDAKQLQSILGCGRKQIYELMNREDFPSFKVGRKLLVEKRNLERWIKSQQYKN